MQCGYLGASGRGHARFSGKAMTALAVLALSAVGFYVLDLQDSSDAVWETSGSCGDSLTWTYDTETGALTVIGTGDMYDYTYHGNKWGRNVVKSVSLPKGLTSIGDFAFQGCDLLASVVIPDSVVTVGENAFYGCSSLTSVTIRGSVTSIEGEAFTNCTSLETITVDGSNQAYSSENGVLFDRDRTNLEQYPAGKTDAEYTVPGSVISIGNSAFHGCTYLTSVTIPDEAASFGSYVFYECTSLTSVNLGNQSPPSGTTRSTGARPWDRSSYPTRSKPSETMRSPSARP